MAAIPGKDHQEIPGHYNTTYPSYVSGTIDFGGSSERVAEQFAKQFATAVGAAYATCYNHLEDASGATYYRSESLKKGLGQHVESAWTGGSPAAANGRAEKKPDTRAGGIHITGEGPTPSKRSSARAADPSLKSVPSKPGPAAPKYVEVPGLDGATVRLSPEVAARNKAAAEEYRRKLDVHAQAKADHDRKLAEHQQNTTNAAAARQAHERVLAAKAAEVAAHQAAMDDYNKKLAGASTNDDPNRCITSPAIKPGLRGNTEVHVTNGCDQKVDIVICLKRTSGDWLCGAQFGILSQRSMTFMSTNATGEIYVDAVTFGSKNKLGRPAGIIK